VSTHLYCILPPTSLAALPPGLTGIDGATVRALDLGQLVAWVSDAESKSAALSGVREHDAVVEAALSAGVTPLPARFGQRFTDDDACVAGIGREVRAVSRLLAAMQGLVEMTLILAPSTKRVVNDLLPVLPEMVGEGPGVGRRYLDALRAREAATGAVRQALDALAQRLSDAAAGLVRSVSVQENLAKMPMRSISHLISREVVDRYRDAVRSVHPGNDYRFLVVGPRAPYSFSVIGEGGGGHGLRLADSA
jgi:hypothetical protein